MNSRGRQTLVERAVMAVAVLFFAYEVAGQTTGKAPVKAGLTASKAPTVPKAAAMTAEESQALLMELNDANKALPASYMFELRHEKIDPQTCFGAKLMNGQRLAGESSGKNYGLRGTKEAREDGVGGSYIVIGSFYSEFRFSIKGKALPAGPYMVHAYSDALELAGDDTKEMRYDNSRRKEVPKGKTATFLLKSPIAAELLAMGAKEGPRFLVSVEGGAIVLLLGENKWSVAPKVTP